MRTLTQPPGALRTMHRMAIAVLLILAAPAAGREVQPYFSLTSARTYAPSEKATVQVYATGVDALEFRVYRINDPIAFFQKVEDLHQFGGRAPELPHKLNWLERFHDWKRELRAAIRDFFRAHFSQKSRAEIRDWWLKRGQKRAGPTPAEYAVLPVLNPQQLVSKWRQNVRAASRWEANTVRVEVPGKGLYLVEAVHGQLRAYTLLNVTELGIVTKSAPGKILAYLQHRIRGNPVADAQVLFLSNRKEVARVNSDANGLADASLDAPRPHDTLVLARHGDDFAVTSLYSWNLSSDPNRYLTGYIYTDRPVYRPGHTVHFKGILRTQLGAEYELPEPREVEIEIQDPNNSAVYRKTRSLSDKGSLQGEFELPVTAALGYYSIRVHLREATVDGGFEVEEYKKPEYEVKVTPAAKRVLQGEPIQATIEARYYFGEPVAGAQVTYVVHTQRYWFPLYAEEEDSSEVGDEGDYYSGEQAVEQKGKLDPDGKLTVSIPTSPSERKADLRYRIEARVTDASNREISGRNFVLATYGTYLVHIRPEQYVYKPGDRARFIVEARDYDAHPVSTPIRVELYRWRWNRPEEAPIQTAQAQTGADGEGRVELSLPEGGSYYAKGVARTPEGREVESRAYVWVTGAAADWYGERRERVQIVPDKKSYRPGEVANVLIVTGTPDAHILLTTEGRTLHARRVVNVTGPTVTVEVPITTEYAPNFYLGVAFLRDNQLYQGSKKIKVPPVEKQLTVEVQSSKDQYRPGEPANYTVTARDSMGRPVSGAEVSLGVVDEAIYAIRPEAARDIAQFFHGESYNRVNTDTSLSYYFHGEAGKRAMPLALTGRRRADLAQLKPERMLEPKIRKAFPDTVFWNASLITDASGRATARFAFPDSLTTWRATARAVTRDTKVGSAVQRVIVRKNLILRLAVPRFFTEGDEVTLSALVHNYLTTEKKTRISLKVEGLEILEGETREVVVAGRADARVDWRVRAKPGRQVKLLGKALTNEESDALELTLPVVPYGVRLSESRAGSVTGSGEVTVELTFPPQAVPTSRTLEIRMTPSPAGAIFGALEYLTSYPYGCTEQTMSSFLPNVVVTKAIRELGVKSNVDEAALQKKAREGLARLYEFQHPDGGWGWWQTDESHAFMTAYALFGLAQARDAGYAVREHSITQAQRWLTETFTREKRIHADLRAYLAYALAESGLKDKTIIAAVWEQRGEMTSYGRALLGLALDALGDPRAKELAAQLEAEAKSDEREAWWPVDRDTLMDFFGDATPETTAYAMKLLARLRPSSPLLPKAAVWLVNHRNEGYYWYSTKQTAMVIFGLMDYLKTGGELKPSFSVAVWVNDQQVLTKQFSEADATSPVMPVVHLAPEQLAAGTNRIRIRKSGAGRLYWSAREEYFSAAGQVAHTGTTQLNILREYFRLVPSREEHRIVYRLEALAGPVASGDIVVVRLTVSGAEWRYLMLEAPVPAGMEFIERDDLYEIKDKPAWWNSWFTRREFHDNRAVFFQTWFGRGQTQYLYLLKAVNPGRYRVSPARVEPMYQPQFLATTDSKVVEVK